MTFDVLYSADGGRRWSALAVNLKRTHFTWDTSGVPGGTRSLIKILATDGVNTAEDVSDATFSVSKKRPMLAITSPTDRAGSCRR